ncbi:MAG: CAAX prenyl protease-related protein [Planctomycetales bacterium]|nr:CAAX prenyl protease-related protein [Planctomycetales bacterium]
MNDENSVPPSDLDSTNDATPEAAVSQVPKERKPRVFGKFAFWIVVFPFIYYLVGMQCGSYLESMRVSFLKGELDQPHHDEEANRPPQEEIDIDSIEVDPDATFLLGLLPLGKNSYPYTYVFNVAVTTAIVLLVGWGYFKVPFRVSIWSVIVGVVGIVVWVGLTELDRNFIHLGESLSSGREAFNPFVALKDEPSFLRKFLIFRFLGLVIIVPLIEEFFVRGFLIRYVDDPDWDEQPLAEAKQLGWLSPTIYGVVAHMTEPFAALAWFSMVTWMYKKTGSIWDCVIAHSITNLLLGIIVVKYGLWYYW